MNTSGKPKIVVWTVPNLLSFFRLALIPLIVWMYGGRHDVVWTVALLGISGLTDIADGYIARRFHQVSDLGKALDPAADKLTQFAMLLCLAARYPNMWIPAGLLLVKELIAFVCGLVIYRRKKEVHGAVWHGKAATVLLYFMMLLHTLWPGIPFWLSNTLIAVCLAMMLLSSVLYTKRSLSILKGEPTGGEQHE